MKTLLILSPFLLIAIYVWACMYIEKRRLRALALADKCRHGTHRSAHCLECEEEDADRQMINQIKARHDYLKGEGWDE